MASKTSQHKNNHDNENTVILYVRNHVFRFFIRHLHTSHAHGSSNFFVQMPKNAVQRFSDLRIVY